MTDWSLPYSSPTPSPPLEKYSVSYELLFLNPFPICLFLVVQKPYSPSPIIIIIFCFVSPLLDNSIVYTSTPLWLLLLCFLCFTLEKEHTPLLVLTLRCKSTHSSHYFFFNSQSCVSSRSVCPLGLKLSRWDSCCKSEREKPKSLKVFFSYSIVGSHRFSNLRMEIGFSRSKILKRPMYPSFHILCSRHPFPMFSLFLSLIINRVLCASFKKRKRHT